MSGEQTRYLFGNTYLAASGQDIVAITLDSNIVLLLGRDREHEFRIGNHLFLDADGERSVVTFDPYSGREAENITELVQLITQKVDRAAAYVSGVLQLVTANGTKLTVNPLPRYEAWTYTCGNFILSCPPGGLLTSK